MDHKTNIHRLLNDAAQEMLSFVKEQEPLFDDRWVPAAEIKNELELNFVAAPKHGTQYGEKGWMFAILARMLEDSDLIEYEKKGSRAYYRSKER